jgi:putative PIN family toxin of toxin-antitoxin system
VRLVLDTNKAVSGLIWGGVPGRLIDAAAAGKVIIIASVPLLDELQGVLSRQRFLASWPNRMQTPTIYSMDMRRWCGLLCHPNFGP